MRNDRPQQPNIQQENTNQPGLATGSEIGGRDTGGPILTAAAEEAGFGCAVPQAGKLNKDDEDHQRQGRAGHQDQGFQLWARTTPHAKNGTASTRSYHQSGPRPPEIVGPSALLLLQTAEGSSSPSCGRPQPPRRWRFRLPQIPEGVKNLPFLVHRCDAQERVLLDHRSNPKSKKDVRDFRGKMCFDF